MKHALTVLLSLPLIATSFGNAAFAADLTDEFDTKHKACLERIAEDNALAFEEAMIWQDEGGGRRASRLSCYGIGWRD